MQHAGVLHAYKGAQHTEHAGWHTKIEADAVRVSCSGTGASADDHLVVWQIFHQFLKKGINCHAAPIDKTLTANFDDISVGQDFQVRVLFCHSIQGTVGQ